MKLSHYSVFSAPPIDKFEVSDLSDTVVLAGPNGVGKTSLLTTLLKAFGNDRSQWNVQLHIQATCKEEIEAWGGKTELDSAEADDAKLLRDSLQKNRKRGSLKSSVLNFDSDRRLVNARPLNPTWDNPDPFEEDLGWSVGLQPMSGRFEDVIHSLFRKMKSHGETIKQTAIRMDREGATHMPLGFSDPLTKFRKAFENLLPGKKLAVLDEGTPEIRYQIGDQLLQLETLSSGEREVVTIVFDFLLRGPEDCIVVFDEPELHLHPELSYRLLRTLRDSGDRNQFIYCTHSPDIITACLEQSVVFVAPPAAGSSNQAVPVKDGDETSTVLNMLGHSIGVISLGKRIVLIEGEKPSLDKQTYGSIVGSSYPELVLVPTGGKETLSTFMKAMQTVLSKTIWGVEFFMLGDGDSVVASADKDELEERSRGRVKLLPRYHVENYFLDENVLALVFQNLDDPESWLCVPSSIRTKLREVARPFISYAAALRAAHQIRQSVGNANLMPSRCDDVSRDRLLSLFGQRAGEERTRISDWLADERVRDVVARQYAMVKAAHDDDNDHWKALIPGRPILNRFAATANLDVARLKRCYLRAAESDGVDPFREIREIFKGFAEHSG